MQDVALQVVQSGHQVTSRHKSAPLRQTLGPVREYYYQLAAALGPQNWWPTTTQFEIVVGGHPHAEYFVDECRAGYREFTLGSNALPSCDVERFHIPVGPAGPSFWLLSTES